MKYLPRVTRFEILRPYVLKLEFSDGTVREVDLEPEINKGKIFEPLKDPYFFASARIEGATVAWPNGADFAPEFLYHDAKSAAEVS